MVHLWGLISVLGGWGKAMQGMTDEQKKKDGVSLHAGADEHSLLLHLRPELVSPKYKEAPVVAGATRDEAFEKSKAADWPGYLGSPRVASKELGERIWRGLADAAIEHALKILDGADPARFARYADYLAKVDRYKGWIDAAAKRDDEIDAKQRAWLRARGK